MRIHVSGKGFTPGTDLQDEIAQRVDSALTRFDSRIVKVHAFLEDANGPKKGVDKSIRLVIHLERLPLVVVEERGEAWRPMVDLVVERASHTVSRQMERLHSRGDRTSMAGDFEAAERVE